jgi:hypothetical protein
MHWEASYKPVKSSRQVAGHYLIFIMSINNKAAFLRLADASCQVNLFQVSKSSCMAPHFEYCPHVFEI